MSDQPGTALRSFLDDPRRPAGTLAYHELQGFLFAVACAPDLVPPLGWMPMIFAEQEAEYGSLEEAQAVIGELMALYNSVNAAVGEDRALLPADCQFRGDLLANLQEKAPVAQWSRGFLRGHQWLEESWEAYVPDELDDEFASMLMTLSFFASKDLAEAFCAETRLDLSEMAAKLQGMFAHAITEYAHLGRSIHQVLLTESAEHSRASSTKVGRNEPCPCGSGRKYKRVLWCHTSLTRSTHQSVSAGLTRTRPGSTVTIAPALSSALYFARTSAAAVPCRSAAKPTRRTMPR